MKKLFYLTAVIVMGLIFASCTKPNDNPNPNEEKTYSFSIGAEKETDDTDETRVEMIDNALHWSVDDKAGMFVYSAGSSAVVVRNIPMTGLHTEPTRTATFIGQLTQSEIEQLSLNPYRNDRHDYISYYPYTTNNNATTVEVNASQATVIRHYLPAAVRVRKNEFSPNVFMLALAKDVPKITWLDENGEQQFGERQTFTYKHIYSYLRVKLGTVPTGESFKFFQLRGYGGAAASLTTAPFQLSGRVNASQETGFYNRGDLHTDANCTLSVIIDGDEMSSGDYIYVPIPSRGRSGYGSGEFNRSTDFLFCFGTNTTDLPYQKKVKPYYFPISIFERGKIYDITINL